MKNIINGAPGLFNPGLNDQSAEPYTRAEVPLPQHLPKFLIYAAKGPTLTDKYPEQLLVGNERNLMYGDATFTEGSDYYNHQTKFSNCANSAGNASMLVRVMGKGYGPKANICLYLDVLETTNDLYVRNDDGTLQPDVTGDPKLTGDTVAGYRVALVVSSNDDIEAEGAFGAKVISDGSQLDPATNTQSKRYPILELQNSWYGKAGNLAGFRLWGQNTDNTGVLPTKMINSARAFPFNFGVVLKDESTGRVNFAKTIMGDSYLTVTLKPSVVDPLTKKKIGFLDRVLSEYQNLTDPKYPLTYGELGAVKLYQENIDTLCAMFHSAEVEAGLESWHDFTEESSEKYMFNFITGETTESIPYKSFVFSDSTDSVRLSKNTNVFLAGGSDGEMNNENFAEEVASYMSRYGDPDDELMDLAYHVESHFYDSGFPLETKYKLLKFIAERKDTFVHLSTSVDGERRLTSSEEYSIAQSLLSTASLYPESSMFNTGVYRVMITQGLAKVRNSTDANDTCCTYSVLDKSANYMGSSTGAFISSNNPEGYPNSVIESMYDFSTVWVSSTMRARFWDVGLNWIGRMDRGQFYMPAMKTVYSEDTSVVTGYIMACILLTVNKVLAKAQRRFSGISGKTPAEFSKIVNNFMTSELLNIFDGRVLIIPRAQFTSMDEIRNYSWTVPVDVGGEGMKTVMTGYAIARRRSSMSQ